MQDLFVMKSQDTQADLNEDFYDLSLCQLAINFLFGS